MLAPYRPKLPRLLLSCRSRTSLSHRRQRNLHPLGCLLRLCA
jgi:hypothetical protein